MRRLCGWVGLWLMLIGWGNAWAQAPGQTVTVTSQFRDIIQPAALWLEVRDPGVGAVRPFYTRLDKRAQSEVFATFSNEFVIYRAWMEFDDSTVLKPCEVDKTKLISNQSVQIMLSGLLDYQFSQPRCHVTYTASQPLPALPPKALQPQQQLATAQPVMTDEGQYYQALTTCQPSAFRFKAYQPFIDEQVQSLVIIEGVENNRCVVIKENNFKSVQGADVTAITRCQFSNRTRSRLTAQAIRRVLAASQDNNAAKNTLYVQAMCDECTALANGKNLACFEKFS